MKIPFIIFSVLLLVYMLLPGPSTISQFKALPDSSKSELPGDTYQVPNVAAYFSDHYRDFVTNFYRSNYKELTFLPFLPIRLNYPPEFSFTTIKQHTDSTYLEEFVYPLRDSLYVNGFEPFYEDGSPKYWGATKFTITDDKDVYTKTTIRFYPSPIWARLAVWLGIVISIFYTFKLGKEALRN